MPADKAQAETADGANWTDVNVGLGDEHDAEKDGPLVGHYIGSTTKELTGDDGEVRLQSVHQFSPQAEPDRIVFLWGGYQLDAAMAEIEQGTLTRITFTGRRQFSGNDGRPRQVKQFRVQTAG